MNSKKMKKIIALFAVTILIVCALLTLVFALIYNYTNQAFYANAWKACAWAMIFIPIILYAMLLIHKVVTNNEKETSDPSKKSR